MRCSVDLHDESLKAEKYSMHESEQVSLERDLTAKQVRTKQNQVLFAELKKDKRLSIFSDQEKWRKKICAESADVDKFSKQKPREGLLW